MPATPRLFCAVLAAALSLAPHAYATAAQQAASSIVPMRVNYLTFLPKNYAATGKPVPMILFLHGTGEIGTDLDLVKKLGPPAIVEQNPDFPFMVVSPQLPPGGSWDPLLLKGMLDDVLAKYNVDRQRVYLTGLSLGGYGAWTLAMRYPQYFAALAPVCGAADPTLIHQLKDVPTWVFHGEKDTAVPEQASAYLTKQLKEAGGNVKYTVLPGGDHPSAWIHAYDVKNGLFDWFLQQRKAK